LELYEPFTEHLSPLIVLHFVKRHFYPLLAQRNPLFFIHFGNFDPQALFQLYQALRVLISRFEITLGKSDVRQLLQVSGEISVYEKLQIKGDGTSVVTEMGIQSVSK
jgi:hypothetical protein